MDCILLICCFVMIMLSLFFCVLVDIAFQRKKKLIWGVLIYAKKEYTSLKIKIEVRNV